MPQFLGAPRVQYFKTATSEFLTGGKLYSYEPGSLTPKATYPTIADATAGTNPNPNPIILDSRGEATVVLEGSTKLVLTDANDVLIWTVDDVGSSSTDILDANGNELIKFTYVPNAVNEFTVTNAATGGKPKIQATGSDTNVGASLTTTGSGELLLDGGSTGQVKINTVSSGAVTIGTATTINSTLTVSGLVTGGSFGPLSIASTATTSFLPAGMVMWKASTNVPDGWLECDGSAVSRTTYAALFADIGTTYGSGDGSTTFNLPSQARRVLVGRGGTGSGTLANTVGSTGGTETVTLTQSQIPTNFIRGTISVLGAAVGGQTVPDASPLAANSGGGQAVNNLQPSLVMMMVIRAY